MNSKAVIFGTFILVAIVSVCIYLLQSSHGVYRPPRTASLISPPEVKREVVQYPLDPGKTIEVDGKKLPEFKLDASDPKLERLLNLKEEEINKAVSVNITHQLRTANIEAEIKKDVNKKELLVAAKDLAHFKPGLYKVSLTLRTIEGEVNLEQDFTWGVLAVNTKKSIYKPGERVHVGIGVLDDGGNTQCKTGFNHISGLKMTITSPSGKITNYDIEDDTIFDSGECAATSVTNEADFQAEFLESDEPGIYQISVESTVKGKTRSIEDYFKVESDPKFDIERTSFPTRIYPFALYPATFTIISSSDFSGEVVDIVPSFFEINNISEGAILEQFGDFVKIKWNVSLKKGVPKQFTYFIKFPPVSPEYYLIGPIKIGSFTEARQWQIASDAINSTSGVLAYEDNAGSTTWSRVWTGTVWNPLPGSTAVSMDNSGDAPDDSRWFRMVSSPKTGEKLVAALDNCGAPINTECIWMYRWTGSAWIEDFTVNVNTPDIDTNMVDVAYEELSGEALLVWGDNTTQLKYRHRSGGSWSGTQNAGTAMDSRKKWVRAKAQFNSDSILVGYLNDNERIGALIWDGSNDTFTNQFDDDDSPSQTETVTSDEAAFDIAWETQSGTPMIFWGTAANTVLSREFSGGAWQGENTVYNSGFAGDVEWVTASADPEPTSNYIALALQESDGDTTEEASDCEFGIWDGTAGITRPAAVTCRSDFDGRINNTAFENTGSRAMWVYVPREGGSGTAGNSMAYRTWTPGGGFTSSTTVSGDTSGNIESLQLHADLNTQSMIALSSDSNTTNSGTDLNYWTWDGSTWVFDSTDLHGAIQNTNENAEAYGFGFDRNLERVVAYRWFANSGTVAVSQAIGTQDTPAQLTSANQQFRLRLLLYTSDTLSTSLRDYKLQYVDPGVGSCEDPTGGTPATWTDVPSSGGTTISFYNNPTPSDGNNLTVNGSLDPSYLGLTVRGQDYEEANNFTNTASSIAAEEVGLWDFSLVDNTPFDRVSQTYCFRVARTSDVVLQIGVYPQISTLAVDDVLIQGGTQIDGSTAVNNP